MAPQKQTPRKKPAKSTSDKLDAALADSFPASDPPAMTDPDVRVGQGRSKKAGKGRST